MLLCAPSLGVLDNWLPVLHAARASHPDWRIVALIPDRATLAQLDPEDTAHVLADEVIDATVAPLIGGGWVEADGFLAAAEAARPRRILSRIRTAAQRRSEFKPKLLGTQSNRLLYDIHLHEKAPLAHLLIDLEPMPRFSMNHGLILEEFGERSISIARPDLERVVFTYADSERDAYSENFSISRDSTAVIGAVRQKGAWVERVVEQSRLQHHQPFERFVFLVSRPHGSEYLPRSRKVEALRALHDVSWHDFGLPIVIRAHPKEFDDGTITDALPKALRGNSWSMSQAHPFHLARSSEVAVTFFSGMALDLVALGVPVIELLDISGLDLTNHPLLRADHRGEPVFGPYRRLGVVIPASDRASLREAFERIRADRAECVQSLAVALSAALPKTPADPETVLAQILEG